MRMLSTVYKLFRKCKSKMLAAENTLISKIEGLENNLFRMQQDILTLEDNISQILVILDTLST